MYWQLGLPNNKVIVNGGLFSATGPGNPTMEIFDPSNQTVTSLQNPLLQTLGYNVAYPSVSPNHCSPKPIP